jgi:hypothetical protein
VKSACNRRCGRRHRAPGSAVYAHLRSGQRWVRHCWREIPIRPTTGSDRESLSTEDFPNPLARLAWLQQNQTGTPPGSAERCARTESSTLTASARASRAHGSSLRSSRRARGVGGIEQRLAAGARVAFARAGAWRVQNPRTPTGVSHTARIEHASSPRWGASRSSRRSRGTRASAGASSAWRRHVHDGSTRGCWSPRHSTTAASFLSFCASDHHATRHGGTCHPVTPRRENRPNLTKLPRT